MWFHVMLESHGVKDYLEIKNTDMAFKVVKKYIKEFNKSNGSSDLNIEHIKNFMQSMSDDTRTTTFTSGNLKITISLITLPSNIVLHQVYRHLLTKNEESDIEIIKKVSESLDLF